LIYPRENEWNDFDSNSFRDADERRLTQIYYLGPPSGGKKITARRWRSNSLVFESACICENLRPKIV